jgi:predicted PurR-regulated permease PerM
VQRNTRPRRHERHGSAGDQCVGSPRDERQGRPEEQVPRGGAGLASASEFGPVVGETATKSVLGVGRIDDAERCRHDPRVRDVPVTLVADQRSFAIPVVGGEEAVELSEVHPFQQMRIVGGIGCAAGRGPFDAPVDAAHPIDGSLGLRRRPERGGCEEVGGALQASPRVTAVVGVLGDSGHRQRVQRLEQQRTQSAHEHRCVGVDAPDRRIVGEPSRFVGVEQLGSSDGLVGPDDARSDLFAEPGADVERHWPIVPRPREYHPDVPEEMPPEPDAAAATSAGSGGRPTDASGRPLERRATDRTLPRWVLPAIVLFWIGYLLTFTTRHVFHRLSSLLVLLLVSVFLSLAIEPGVNRLAARGWRRGRATITILFGVLAAFLIFAGAVGTLVGTQVADLLAESDAYITDTVNFLNDNFGSNIDPQDVIEEFNDPDGRVQQFIQSQSDEAVRLSLAVVAVIFQMLSVLLFTYYLVADGPRMRRGICARLSPARQAQVLRAWELAITKTGGYLYSRALLALLSAFFHWIVFQSIGTPAPVALALWVGLVSQFLPVVGTYLAGVLPVLLTLLDSPLNAAIVIGFIVVYQQIENYFFAPRITARTMELHPAVAFGAALGGASLLGFVGALLALPAAAMVQALTSEWGNRYDVLDSHLTAVPEPRSARSTGRPDAPPGGGTTTPDPA